MAISAEKNVAHLPGIPMSAAADDGANSSLLDKVKEKGSQIYDALKSVATHPGTAAALKTAVVATVSAPAAIMTGLSELSVTGKEKQIQALLAEMESQVFFLKNHRLADQASRLGSCKTKIDFFKRQQNGPKTDGVEVQIDKIDQLMNNEAEFLRKSREDRKEEPEKKRQQELFFKNEIENHLRQVDRELSVMEARVIVETNNELQRVKQSEKNLAAQVKADTARLKALEDQVQGNCCIKHCVIL